MTMQKNFKKRVRERMAQTGESYTTARAKILAEKAVLPCEASSAAAAISNSRKETP